MNKQLLIKKFMSIKKSKKIVSSIEAIALHRAHTSMQDLISSRNYLRVQSDVFSYLPALVRTPQKESFNDIILIGNQSGLCFAILDGIWKKLLKHLKICGPRVRLWVSGQNFYNRQKSRLQELDLELHYIPNKGIKELITPWVSDWILGLTSTVYLIHPKFQNIYHYDIVGKGVWPDKLIYSPIEVLSLPDLPLNQTQGLEMYLMAILHNASQEAYISECASKGLSMKTAKDNADDLIYKYNIKINTVTQGLITQELNELMIGN